MLDLGSFLTTSAYIHSGILGATFFATAILAYSLPKRLYLSESAIIEKSIKVAELKQLNELIIQRMPSGIIVDKNDHICYMNHSAWILLGKPFTKK